MVDATVKNLGYMTFFVVLLIIAILCFFIWLVFYIPYRIIKFFVKLILEKVSESDKLMIRTFVAMAKLTPDYHVDKKLTVQIGDMVKSAFREMGGVKYMDAIMEEFHRVSRQGNTIKVSQLQDELDRFETKDFQFKKEFMIGLLSIAYANGNLDENQGKLLDMVKKSIGMTDFAYSRVESMFWSRMRSGKYMDYEEFKKRRFEWNERNYKKKESGYRREESYSQYNYSNSSKKQEERREYRQSSSYTHVPTELEKAYSVLGLSPDASVDDIKKMKRELLKKYHPDLYSGKGERAVEEATIKSQRINQAYEMIMRMKN